MKVWFLAACAAFCFSAVGCSQQGQSDLMGSTQADAVASTPTVRSAPRAVATPSADEAWDTAPSLISVGDSQARVVGDQPIAVDSGETDEAGEPIVILPAVEIGADDLVSANDPR